MPRYQAYVGDALETGMFEEKSETNASRARGSNIVESPTESFVAKRKSVAQTEDALSESNEVCGAGLAFEALHAEYPIGPVIMWGKKRKKANR